MTQSTTGYVENTISDKSLSIEALIDESIKVIEILMGLLRGLSILLKAVQICKAIRIGL